MSWCQTGDWVLPPNQQNKGGLMISGFHYAENQANLLNNNIIATASIVVPSHYLRITMPPQIIHKFFPIQDDEDESIQHFFNPTYQFICYHLQKGNVLVHCQMGTSRSAAIVCAYLMKKYSWSTKQALEYLRLKRPCVNPNKGFMKDLLKWQKQIQINHMKNTK